jgi:WD40 repeat protein
MTPAGDSLQLGAYVCAILEDRGQAVFALGDGSVRWEDGAIVQAHQGAVLCAAVHPSGEGVITGGDDGRLVWSDGRTTRVLEETPGRWIDALAVAPASGLIALASGKRVTVIDPAEPKFRREFAHSASVAGLAFDAGGRRLAAATYGGVALWYARIAAQKPVMLRCAGSHLAVRFSRDARFVVSAMQEPALHAWRLADGQDMAMSGYAARVRAFAFGDGGRWLATSGAPGVVLWPFTGSGGPMGKQALQVDLPLQGVTTMVALDPLGAVIAGSAEDGRVAFKVTADDRQGLVKNEPGPPISALAVLEDLRIAWGDEAGGAGVAVAA